MKSLRQIFPKASNAFLAANAKVLTSIANDIATADAAVHLGLLHPPKKPRMNATETDFKLLLLARFPDCTIRFEAYKLRIADRCWYTPDFSVLHLNGTLDFYECKGRHIWEDGKLKFKAAREMYPQHHWEMWQKKGASWTRLL